MASRAAEGVTALEVWRGDEGLAGWQRRRDCLDYPAAVCYLESLMRFGMHLGLERIGLLLHLLGEPHLNLPVIHVGGTNGKGSTAAMLAGILQAAGYRTGLFISPHLHSYTERFSVNGASITPADFAAAVAEVKPAVEEMTAGGCEQPTEFEVLTAMAFRYFRRQQVDVAVLEVGLGGELDATNVVPDPLVSVITNVGWDHMDRLGDTLTAIARAKAGIVKRGGYVVTAATAPEALAVIEARCKALGATLFRVYQEATWQAGETLPHGQYFSLTVLGRFYPQLFLSLRGAHQLVNAATAVLASEVLRRHRGLTIHEEAVRRGLAGVRWPGRLEVVATAPTVVIDVAHNRDAALALRQALSLFSYRHLVLVVGMLGDKEREKVMEILAPLAQAVVVTRPLSPRAGAWEELATFARRYVEAVYLEREISAALATARRLAGPSDLILVTGSFYMVGEARACLVKEDSWAGCRILR